MDPNQQQPPPPPPQPQPANLADVIAAVNLLNQQIQNLQAANDQLTDQNRRQADAIVTLTAHQARPPPPPARGPPPRPLNISFGNTAAEDWISFRKKFETHAETQRYDLQDGKNMLLTSMVGQAFVTASRLNHRDMTEDLQALLALYETKFLPPSASATAILKYDQAMQGAHETVLDWHGRLDNLWSRAYPRIDGGQLLIKKFINGLRIKALRQFTMRAKPQTYDDALVSAMEEQCVQETTVFGQSYGQQVPQAGGGHPGHQGRGEPMEIGAMGEQKRCYTCNLFGHEKKDCKFMRRPTTLAVGSRGTSRPGGAAPRARVAAVQAVFRRSEHQLAGEGQVLPQEEVHRGHGPGGGGRGRRPRGGARGRR